MRITILSLLLLVVTTITAQTQPLTPVSANPLLQQSIEKLNKKWSITKYAGMSAGMGFFNGGNATFLSVPVGLQLNRKLSNSLYAFGGVSVAPTYFNFNGAYLNNNIKAMQHSLGMYNQTAIIPRAELGLMYVNEAKTFSISGSVGVQRGGYSLYPLQPLNRLNNSPVNTFNNWQR